MLAHEKHYVLAIIILILIIVIIISLLLRNLRAGQLPATPLLPILFILTLAVALGFALGLKARIGENQWPLKAALNISESDMTCCWIW